MMKRRILHIICLLACLAGVMAPSARAMALDVNNIRLGSYPDKTRLVVELGDAADFRAFMLADPVRLVIDLPHFNWRAGQIEKPAGANIHEIRQGALQPGVARIVIGLNRPSLIQSAFFLPRGDGQPNRLVIDYATTDTAGFARNRSRVFGTLNPDAPAQMAATTTPPAATGTNATIAPPPQKPASASKPSAPIPVAQRPLIILDAGHGGADPGAISGDGKLKEKDITLAMARDLKAALEKTGRYRVVLTRERDIFIRLSQRVAFARQKQADLFISLHADSINRSGVRGASVYTLSEKASDAETEKLAARENHADMIGGLDLSVEDEDVANILVDLTRRDTMNQSKFFANKIVDLLRGGGIRTLENPHRFAGFAVLKAPDIPSVLIELGYMSNQQESAMLSSPAYRARIADALVTGIDRYFATTRQ